MTLPGWWQPWSLVQVLEHSGGFVPHGIGGYITSAPQWHVNSSKSTVK